MKLKRHRNPELLIVRNPYLGENPSFKHPEDREQYEAAKIRGWKHAADELKEENKRKGTLVDNLERRFIPEFDAASEQYCRTIADGFFDYDSPLDHAVTTASVYARKHGENPSRRKPKMIKRRKRTKAKNHPLTVKVGGRRYTWKRFIQKFSTSGKNNLKKLARKWKSAKKFHGGKPVPCGRSKSKKGRK